jgi:membrane associated rhomboid family serine protease
MYIGPVGLLLALLAGAAFYLQQQAGDALTIAWGLWPVESGRFQLPQILTYSMLHATGVHLAMNLFALVVFGAEIEHRLGSLRFLSYYLAAVVSGALLQLAVAIILGTVHRPVLGASAGVFGVLLAYAMLFPRRPLMPVFLPVPVPAWLFVSLYGGLELVLGMLETEDGIAHSAHLGGMLGGWLLMQYWRDKLRPAEAEG